MTARAIWKGVLQLGRLDVPVRLYSAVEDRTIHFRLLHKSDRAPVEQRLVRKKDGEVVAKQDLRKTFAIDDKRAVILEPEELEKIEPDDSRCIVLSRFVAAVAVSHQWYDRPYMLGPDKDAKSYFALAEAIARKGVLGVARWIMRDKRYVGALGATAGYLSLTTFRRAEQLIELSVDGANGSAPNDKELELAEQLIAHVSGDFEPAAWRDDYRERVQALVKAKARGKAVKAKVAKPARRAGGLAAQLRQSLAAASEKKVA